MQLTKYLILLAFLACSAAGLTAELAAGPPNVLFIAVDDLRPELGCYGDTQARTPHIDQLAALGVRFERAYCQVPVCGASRAALMTSILPTPKRFVNFDSRVDIDAPNAATLPQVFRQAGYTTLSNGKVFHHTGDTSERSWSQPAWRPSNTKNSHDLETMRQRSTKERGRIFEFPDVPDDAYHDGQIAIKTIDDLRRLKQSGQPFFLACGFLKPHLPFYAPKKYWDLYLRDEIDIADNRQPPQNAPTQLKGSGEFRSYHLADFDEDSDDFHRLMRHGYLACTSYIDKLIGDVLAELNRLGLADSTIIVLWGDHGWHLGEHGFWGKHNTMHLAMRIPLIVKVPGKKAGSSAALVETIDLFPTLCMLTGIAIPESVQGRSFTELLDHPERRHREVAYSRFQSGDAVITDQFTYTCYQGGKSEMLYDLSRDPLENTNVAGESEYAAKLGEMREFLNNRKAQAASAQF
ncbi:MAG: sulfatase [Pirellulaceae bacterium]|nr:sulfatase [Pirellulaceae bacterium]